MPLDPQAQNLLDMAAKLGLPPIYHLPVAEARARMRAQFFDPNAEREPVHKVEDLVIPGPVEVPVRVYTPSDKDQLPVLVFCHGGGMVVNDLDTHDALCRYLTNAAECITVSVDYRRAPEHKYPAAVEDAYTATQWVANNATRLGADVKRIAVGGDSSGGYMATIVALLARDRGGPELMFQWMAYPVTDYYLPGTPSYKENATGYSLDRDWMIWAWNQYLPDDFDRNDPYLFPLRAEDLSGLPPAFIQTGNYDPLRDEGEMYAKRLEGAGVPVVLHRYEGMMHGYIMAAKLLDKGRAARTEAADALRAAFSQ